jgi:hypothetical protein
VGDGELEELLLILPRTTLLSWFRLLTSSVDRYNSTSSATFVSLKKDDVIGLC